MLAIGILRCSSPGLAARRGGLGWLVVLATFAVMLALKLVFLACSASFGTTEIRTPSGHVAAATVVAGGLAALLLRRRRAALPLAALAAVADRHLAPGARHCTRRRRW